MVRAQNVFEAPGEVALDYRPAGIGSRFLASALDHLVLLGILFLIVSLLTSGAVPASFAPVLLPLVIILYLTYFAFFEIRYGRTVGKAALDLRVIRDDGRALDARSGVVRSLVRLADALPASYLAAVLVMSLDPLQRRLGDLLAGTVVVHEHSLDSPVDLALNLPIRRKARHPQEILDRIRLTPPEYQALRTFCFRTRTMPVARRTALAARLLAPLYARAGLPLARPKVQEELLVDLMHHLNDTFGEPEVVEPRAAPPN